MSDKFQEQVLFMLQQLITGQQEIHAVVKQMLEDFEQFREDRGSQQPWGRVGYAER
jgi:hypothetical protein